MGKKRYSRKEKHAFAKQLRDAPTESERILWEHLQKRALGPKFYRQRIIKGWIVDFYCPAARLVVELDGAYHHTPAARARDHTRDLAMAAAGITTLRIPSRYVFTKIGWVLHTINRKVKELTDLSAQRHAPL